MTDERDLLNRIVFPHLREFCGKRGLRFIGIDLRWGITEEDSEEKKTLKICLDEIERCRPYFAGIIGNRYGWIPPIEFYVNADRVFEPDISVTEAEIVSGAFSGERARAIFCIKAADAVSSESPQSQQRLALLREKIEMSDYPLLRYAAVDDIAGFFIEQFTAYIEQDFPIQANKDEYQIENEKQRFYMAGHGGHFCGREKELNAIINENPRQGRLYFVDGPAGVGKTAFLAAVITKWEAKYKEGFSFFCFKDAMLPGSDWRFTLRRLINELSARLGTSYPTPESDAEIIAGFTTILCEAGKLLGHVLIVIDDVEKVTNDSKYGFSWIPTRIPQHVSIVLTSNDQRTKELIAERPKVRTIHIKTLRNDEIRTVIHNHLQNYGKKLDPRYYKPILSAEVARNPMFLLTLLSELTVWNSFETLYDRILYYINSENMLALFDRVLIRLEEEHGSELISTILAYLYASNTGLNEQELMDTLCLEQGRWYPAFYSLKPYLLESGGIFYFCGHALKDAVEKRYIKAKTGKYADINKSAKKKILQTLQGSMNESRCMWQVLSLYADLRLYGRVRRMINDPATFTRMWRSNPYQTIYYFTYINENEKKLVQSVLNKKRVNGEEYFAVAEFCNRLSRFNETALIIDRLLAQENITNELKLKALSLLGNMHIRTGSYKQAEDVFEQKRRLCIETGDEIEYARALASLGLLMTYRHEYKGSIRKYRDAKRVFLKHHYPDGVQAAIGNIGNAYLKMNETDRAIKCYREQERLCRETNNQHGIFSALSGQFVVTVNEEPAHAEIILERQRKICTEYGYEAGLEIVLGNQALLEFNRKNYESSKELLGEKLTLAKRLKLFEGQNVALANLADISYQQHDLGEATRYARERVRLCRAERNPRELLDALSRQALYLKEAGLETELGLVELEIAALVSMHKFRKDCVQ